MLYKKGLIAISADEFSRTIKAYYWTQDIRLIFEGVWLPFGYYLEGLALMVWNNLFMAPRITTLTASILATVAVYFLAIALFDNKKIAVIAVLIAIFNPIVNLYSYLPFVCMYHCAAIVWSFVFFQYWLRRRQARFLLFTSITLFIASGFRYESWFFIAPYSIYVLFLALKRLKSQWKQSVCFLAIATIPVIFCLSWMTAGFLRSGHIMESHQIREEYFQKSPNITKGDGFLSQTMVLPKEFISINFFIITALVLMFLFILFLNRKNSGMFFNSKNIIIHSAALLTVFFVLCCYMGFAGPPLIKDRIIIPFFLGLLPLGGWVLSRLFTLFSGSKKNLVVNSAIAVVVVLFVIIFQGKGLFGIPKNSLANETRLGFEIKNLIEDCVIKDNEKILLQLQYWGYRGIVVGSNNPDIFIFDGHVNPLINHGKNFSAIKEYHRSILAFNPAIIKGYIEKNNVHYAVVRGYGPLNNLSKSVKIKVLSQKGYWLLVKILGE
ncbi:MAG: hypothetical protein K8R02_08815 [Anaerohalosphaeraceae bacterium]|nr:hypothetical protein [Anaerohalosphaeraceae bacterium]